MSEFHVVEIEMKDQSCLVKALEELGYKPKIYIDPINLYGYRGDKRSQKAHIVLPRSQVGSSSNDIGFEKKGDSYILHISAYDKSSKTFDLQKLKQNYSKHKIDKFVKSNSRFRKKSMSVDKQGNIRIRISMRGF